MHILGHCCESKLSVLNEINEANSLGERLSIKLASMKSFLETLSGSTTFVIRFSVRYKAFTYRETLIADYCGCKLPRNAVLTVSAMAALPILLHISRNISMALPSDLALLLICTIFTVSIQVWKSTLIAFHPLIHLCRNPA